MLFIYRLLINFIYFISPLIILFRLLKKKEHSIRFKEKIGFFSKKKINGSLIWFHGASVGELQSIIPLVEKFEKDNNIKQILITSNTLSSSNIIKKIKSKKIIHQFFPIDTNYISKKFINYWKPSKVFFIDSEIWPNTIFNLNALKIPIILINGRITYKTFKRWNFFKKFSKEIFSKFNLCLASSRESFNFLKKLKVKKVKLVGNLKFSQSEFEISKIDHKLNGFLRKKRVWCAASTHQPEEMICGNVHLKLKKKFNNLLTIIIPRHVERCIQIKKDLEKNNLKVYVENSSDKLRSDVDIYLVNSYGKTKNFFNITNDVFLGGSLIKHGGQNPLEAARLGCNIISGPFTKNFSEIYAFLEKNKISRKTNNQRELLNSLNILLKNKIKNNKIKHKLKIIGQNILTKTYREISLVNK
tara:strand:- start:6759 stop:8003 length:1245 start_codon:yes stop_codon:yes gene_type:complete